MYTSSLLSLRLFTNCSHLCGIKHCYLSLIRWQSCIATASFARTTSYPVSSRKSYLQQNSHRLKSRQNKLLWPMSVVPYSSAATESSTPENIVPKRKRESMVTIRRERLQNQSVIQEIIARKADETWTDSDWASLAESLSLAGSDSWEVIVMHTLYKDKNISVARNLMKYLEVQGKLPNLIILTLYIGLLGETSSGSENQAEETYRHYQLLLSQTDILDPASIEVLISGLSMTRFYQECVKLLRVSQETSPPSLSNLVKILRAGLRNKDREICQLAITALEESADPSGFIPFLSQVTGECLAVGNEPGLEMVMSFAQKHKLLFPRKALEEITEMFHRYQPNQWTANYGYIHHRSGCCVVCGHQMDRPEVRDDDFRAIRSAFLDQVIVGRNVFFKTSPEEVNKFVEFVQKKGPFDVVIDGLNMVYMKNKKPSQIQLEKAVEHFYSQGKRILILGSKMLARYLVNIRNMKPQPAVYMTLTSKADDAFFLYAALHSGKDTLVVSGDKLRDHKFLLEPSLRPIFHQWVLSAQVYDWFISKTGDFKIGQRHLFITGPAKDEGGWHLPEYDVNLFNPFGKFSVLCLRSQIKQTVHKKVDTQDSRSSTELHLQTTPGSGVGPAKPDIGPAKPGRGPTRPVTDQAKPSNKGRAQDKLLRPDNDTTTSNRRVTKKVGNKVSHSSNRNLKNDGEWFDN